MPELFRGEILSLYSQVALVDYVKKNSYPEWQTGEETFVYSPFGIAVATKGDSRIEVIVSTGVTKEYGNLLAEIELSIGKNGILVGNVPAACLTHIDFPEGKAHVQIFTNGIRENATKVVFVLQK